jgi:hypothetical protein
MTIAQMATTDLLEGKSRSQSASVRLSHPTPTALLISTHYQSGELRRSDSVVVHTKPKKTKSPESKSNPLLDPQLESDSEKKTTPISPKSDAPRHSEDDTLTVTTHYKKRSLAPSSSPLLRRSLSSTNMTGKSTIQSTKNDNNSTTSSLVSSKSSSALITTTKKIPPAPRNTNIWDEKKDSEGNILFENEGDRLEVKYTIFSLSLSLFLFLFLFSIVSHIFSLEPER